MNQTGHEATTVEKSELKVNKSFCSPTVESAGEQKERTTEQRESRREGVLVGEKDQGRGESKDD